MAADTTDADTAASDTADADLTAADAAAPDLVKLPHVDINAIVEESSRVTQADRDANARYDYSETDLESDGSHKTYAVHMLFGSPYRELIAVNGKPLPKARADEEQRKLREEINRREHETPDQRARRIAAFNKDSTRDRHFIQEFVHAFTFKLRRVVNVDRREVYVVDAVPRPGYKPPDRDSTVLTGMRGTLWIDEQTKQWVKAEAHVYHPVSIEGFVATVMPGTRFELEKVPVDDHVWLPRHFVMKAEAKVLYLFSHKEDQNITYFDYHHASQKTD